MNWALDIALAAIILIIVIVNTCKGFKTVLNLLVTLVSFGTAYYIGPDVGRMFVTDIISEKVTLFISNILQNVIGDTVETVTVGDLIEKLPESFSSLLDRIGIKVETVIEAFGETTVIGEGIVDDIADRLAVPVTNWLSIAAGCVGVFLIALLVMLLIKTLIELIVKLPVLKQVGHLFGFIVGVFSAFVWVWVICLAVSFLMEYSLLGEYNSILTELTATSHIFEFFQNFSLTNLLDAVTI